MTLKKQEECNKQYSIKMQQYPISSKTKLLAVFGNPARHSLSPKIQNKFLNDNDIDALYMTFEFPEEKFIGAFTGAKSMGIFGLNITMPYKEKAFELCDSRDKLAESTGSVNTVIFENKKGITKVKGFNTDIEGFIMSLENKNCSLEKLNCLIIGAGGAARSALYGLLQRKPKKIFIYNRTEEKAQKIREIFHKKEKITVLKDLKGKDLIEKVDLICNCTPIGMDTNNFEGLLPIPVEWSLKGKVVFETIYKPVETALLKKARTDGACLVIDGLDMLINQAASSFKKWFGKFPKTENIKQILTE